MIFVTVGTHEQPFNRLMEAVAELVAQETIKEELVVQYGFSTLVPRGCQAEDFLDADAMQGYMNRAHIIITHGGPASFMAAMQMGKVPLVVPRRFEFGEHVNDHQVRFVNMVDQRMGGMIPIYQMDDLGDAIENFDHLVESRHLHFKSNQEQFTGRFEELCKEVLGR
ncbi:glycosyltransferase [Bifidobacterium aemilianum]|uniref:Glycosyltransferase n=1 Tax=Bifidobacterium aemilianum TaxID=2493120 RepID=A0A366K9V2_9BIFI|nr:glycosyltransferase [Bifidobacterium aemilianum]RBP98506.1 glycosyltransferase [Bifidobacterium aemilianum]